MIPELIPRPVERVLASNSPYSNCQKGANWRRYGQDKFLHKSILRASLASSLYFPSLRANRRHQKVTTRLAATLVAVGDNTDMLKLRLFCPLGFAGLSVAIGLQQGKPPEQPCRLIRTLPDGYCVRYAVTILSIKRSVIHAANIK